MREYLDLWAQRSITAWEVWLPEVDRAAARIERLLGAPAGTVTMNQNVSTVEAVLASCFDYDGERNEIVYDDQNFPSVSYVWKAEERRGAKVRIVESRPGATAVDTEALCAAITERTLVGAHLARGVPHRPRAGRQAHHRPGARGRRPGGPRLLPVAGHRALRHRRAGGRLRLRRLGEVAVRRAGGRLPLRAPGSDPALRPAHHRLVRSREAVRLHHARAALRRERLALHRRHPGGGRVLPGARRRRDRRRGRRRRHPREVAAARRSA
jgi:hypothetical protein